MKINQPMAHSNSGNVNDMTQLTKDGGVSFDMPKAPIIKKYNRD